MQVDLSFDRSTSILIYTTAAGFCLILAYYDCTVCTGDMLLFDSIFF